MAFEQRSAEYKTMPDLERGVRSMGEQGWKVVTQSSHTPRKGCLRTLAGGFLFFNRRPVHVVTYQRTAGEAQ